MPSVGIMTQCASIRAKDKPLEKCSNKAQTGSEWCGRHKTTQVRYLDNTGDSISAPLAETKPKPKPETKPKTNTDTKPKPEATDKEKAAAAHRICSVWRRHLAQRTGPLLRHRDMANNPFDFFSSDPVAEIPLQDFTSFVDADGKGYIMDVKSVISLLSHAESNKEVPLNPFNRASLPPLFLQRIKKRQQHKKVAGWAVIQPHTEEQRLSLAVTDVFRMMEDQGYYTDPSWFIDLGRLDLQRLYLEIADIWMHRASLSTNDKNRIVPPPGKVIKMATRAVVLMPLKGLRPLLLETCKTLVSSATESSDRRLGVMYVLGALSCISQGAAEAYPWLVEMFAPGCVSRVTAGQLHVIHPSVLAY
uniref:Uncharacterized protein n=1 Tax=viral metagenome TaxID=1070528 RepID=A0A6C0DAV2_9ZZZZ